jgi:hypothetical protein
MNKGKIVLEKKFHLDRFSLLQILGLENNRIFNSQVTSSIYFKNMSLVCRINEEVLSCVSYNKRICYFDLVHIELIWLIFDD